MMKDYIKKDYIQYKIYDKCVKCRNGSLIRKYSSGYILICHVTKGYTFVKCAIKTDFKNPGGVIADIRSIRLPESEDNYYTICILPKEASKTNLDYISYIIGHLDLSKKSNSNAPVYETSDADKKYYFIPDVTVGIDDAFFVSEFGLTKHINVDYIFNYKVEDTLEEQVQKWYEKTTFKEFKEAIESRVKGQDNLKIILTNVYLYLQSIAKKQRIPRLNLILTGPSGCGKTETQRALKDYFKEHIPKLVVSLVDMNQITSEGFKGHDTKYMVSEIKSANTGGIGIVFLDEFDKRLIPQYSGSGDNVNGEIQHQLLEAIEGYNLDGVDTSKTMFIGMGSFDMVRASREAKAKNTKHFGFGVERKNDEIDHFSEITREEMLELGACNELIGRFGQIVSFGALSNEAINAIIDMRVKEISEDVGVKVMVGDTMRKYLHENSNTKFGNRLIKTLISETVISAMSEILDETDCKEILVTGKKQYKILECAPEN